MTRASTSRVVELKPVPASAEGWCARLHADDVTEADRTAFQAWLEVSAENRAEYELSELTFSLARGLAAAPELRRVAPIKTRKSRRLPIAMAAALLLCTLAGALWYLSRQGYATDVGEQKLVSLADGSTVQLNTASAISVDLDKAQRQVKLRRGEAFFSVAPDPARPFIVQAGRSEIRVLGTKFNVRVDGDIAQVTVLEGRVNVKGGAAKTQAADVLPGQSVAVASAQPAVRFLAASAARQTSWREGKIYFDHEPLAQVLAEVNRYTERRFVIADAKVSDLKLSGVFRTGDGESVAFALRETYGLHIKPAGDSIQVY